MLAATAPLLAVGDDLKVAVATTVHGTGLADELAAGYGAVCSCELRMIVAGSSRALAILGSGDAMAAITHAPGLERGFVAQGAGRTRAEFMRNGFVVAGPAADPAAVRGLGIEQALGKIQAARATFLTRGDGSGTNLAELAMWRSLGPVPSPSDWYRSAGLPMAQALVVAGQMGAYTLSDTGTLAALRNSGVTDLVALAQGGPHSANVYSVIVADQSDTQAAGFAAWLVGDEAQNLITEFRIGGEAVFTVSP